MEMGPKQHIPFLWVLLTSPYSVSTVTDSVAWWSRSPWDHPHFNNCNTSFQFGSLQTTSGFNNSLEGLSWNSLRAVRMIVYYCKRIQMKVSRRGAQGRVQRVPNGAQSFQGRGTGLPFQVMCDKQRASPTRAVHPSLRVQSFSRMLSHGHHWLAGLISASQSSEVKPVPWPKSPTFNHIVLDYLKWTQGPQTNKNIPIRHDIPTALEITSRSWGQRLDFFKGQD